MAFLAVVSVIYIFFNTELVSIFTHDVNVLAFGSECLRTIAFGYILFAWGMVMPQAFNGAGDTITPTKINFVCFWLLEIPAAYLLAIHMGFGPSGVFWSIVGAESLAGIIGIIIFRKGTWKQVQV
jgi:Na+-driven multidrug efflux pump